MPNQYSEDSRRVTYVEDRTMFEIMEARSKATGVSVGELIRRAVAKVYNDPMADAFYQVEPDTGLLDEPLTKSKIVARSKVPYPEQSGVTFTVACEEVSISTSFEDSVVVRLKEVQDAYWEQDHPPFRIENDRDEKAS